MTLLRVAGGLNAKDPVNGRKFSPVSFDGCP